MEWYRINDFLGYEESYWWMFYRITSVTINGRVDHWEATNFGDGGGDFDTFEDAKSWCESDFKKLTIYQEGGKNEITSDRIDMPSWEELQGRITNGERD